MAVVGTPHSCAANPSGLGGIGNWKVVIVTGSVTAPNQTAWPGVMRRNLTENDPEVELLETLVPDENQNRARQMTLELLTAEPDLAGCGGSGRWLFRGWPRRSSRREKLAQCLWRGGVWRPR